MTAARSTFRQRRRTSGANLKIQKNIAQWFAGERRSTVYAFTYPWRALLPLYWAAWQQEHPNAVPPANALPHMLRDPRPGTHEAEIAAQYRAKFLTNDQDKEAQ